MIFTIKCNFLLLLELYQREIKLHADSTTEKRVCYNFSVKRQHRKEDSDQNLLLLINRNACLVFLSFKITLFPI